MAKIEYRTGHICGNERGFAEDIWNSAEIKEFNTLLECTQWAELSELKLPEFELFEVIRIQNES